MVAGSNVTSYIRRHFACRNSWTHSRYSKYEYVNRASANDTLTDIKTQVCLSSKKWITVNGIYSAVFFQLRVNMVMMFWKTRILWLSLGLLFSSNFIQKFTKHKKRVRNKQRVGINRNTKTNIQTKKRLLYDFIKMMFFDSGITFAHLLSPKPVFRCVSHSVCEIQSIVKLYFRLPSTFFLSHRMLKQTMKAQHDANGGFLHVP